MDEKNLCKTRAFHVNEINLIHIKKYQIKNINNTDILLQIYFFVPPCKQYSGAH